MRCWFPEDFLQCYPWPAELAVTNRVLRKIKCKGRVPNRPDGNDQCVVVGDDGGVFVTGASFSPTPFGGTDAGLQTTFTRYAASALQNATADLLTMARISWDGQGRLQALMVGGRSGTVMHLVPYDGDYAFELQETETVDDIMYIAEYDSMASVGDLLTVMSSSSADSFTTNITSPPTLRASWRIRPAPPCRMSMETIRSASSSRWCEGGRMVVDLQAADGFAVPADGRTGGE